MKILSSAYFSILRRLSTESWPQNPEIGNIAENFHTCTFCTKIYLYGPGYNILVLLALVTNWKKFNEAIIICLIPHFEADFPQKVGFKILKSGILMKTFTHVHFVLRSIYMGHNTLFWCSWHWQAAKAWESAHLHSLTRP